MNRLRAFKTISEGINWPYKIQLMFASPVCQMTVKKSKFRADLTDKRCKQKSWTSAFHTLGAPSSFWYKFSFELGLPNGQFMQSERSETKVLKHFLVHLSEHSNMIYISIHRLMGTVMVLGSHSRNKIEFTDFSISSPPTKSRSCTHSLKRGLPCSNLSTKS